VIVLAQAAETHVRGRALSRTHDRASLQVRPTNYGARHCRSRFLQVDPVEGGSCSDYDYGCGDSINNFDLDGTKCRAGDANSKMQAKYSRRDITGKNGRLSANLRCGNKGWGRRHIERRGHFGGRLNNFEMGLIGATLANRNSLRSSEWSRDGSTGYLIYEYGFGCRNVSGRVVFNFTVRVAVNNRTNNIVSAYITDPAWDRKGVTEMDCG
jgi:hypothetical protein